MYKAPKELDKYLQKINKIVNEQIFGTTKDPFNFIVPYDEKKKCIGDITLDGDKCHQLSYNFTPLIEFCYKNVISQEKWKTIIHHYLEAFKLLKLKDDLSSDEIIQFQKNVDTFFQLYMEFIGRRGITNYFHMLGAGHVAHYLKICGNLYIHSQQGWEAYNSFLKVFYFRRTTRGGGRGNSDCNRIRQLARWNGRRLVWNSGMEFKDMLTMNCASVEEEYSIHDEVNTIQDKEFVEMISSSIFSTGTTEADFTDEGQIVPSEADYTSNQDTTNGSTEDLTYNCTNVALNKLL